MLALPLLLLAAAPRVLIVGGGPDRRNNQIAIESNVRYVAASLPKGATLRILFADGDATNPTVRYSPDGGGKDRYRRPNLPRLDGPARLETVRQEIGALAHGAGSPVLLYFTGHGSLEDGSDDASRFDLWRGPGLLVGGLAAMLAPVPKRAPVTLLMVQCHAGGFARLLFPGGDATKPPLDNRLCGFYASIAALPAAGCTPSLDEADYHDFTGYFVAALTGKDRLGRPSTGADYDRNGRVGMDEAFCWAMVNDDSIDTPVCTSDEFLRRVIPSKDEDVFAVPYAQVLAWASPSRKAALIALSSRLKLSGKDRLATAYARYADVEHLDDTDDLNAIRGFRLLRIAKSVVLAHTMLSHPDPALRRRFATLLKDESANPLRP